MVKQDFITEDGFPLGVWVHRQRRRKKKLSEEKIAQLDSLGFIWHPFKQQWFEGLEHLQKYMSGNPNKDIPFNFITADNFKLGQWVRTQRTYKESLSTERIERLDKLGFIWENRKPTSASKND